MHLAEKLIVKGGYVLLFCDHLLNDVIFLFFLSPFFSYVVVQWATLEMNARTVSTRISDFQLQHEKLLSSV